MGNLRLWILVLGLYVGVLADSEERPPRHTAENDDIAENDQLKSNEAENISRLTRAELKPDWNFNGKSIITALDQLTDPANQKSVYNSSAQHIGRAKRIPRSVSATDLQTWINSANTTQLALNLSNLTVEDLGNLLKNLTIEDVALLFNRLPADTISAMIMSLSSNVVNELLGQWSPELIVNVSTVLNSRQMAQLVGDLSTASLLRVAQILPRDRLSQIITAVPVDVVVNLTDVLNATQLQTLLSVIAPESLAVILSNFTEDALTGLLTKIPTAMITDIVVTLPPKDLTSLLSKLKPDVVVNLTSTLSQDQLSQLLILMARDPEGLATFMLAIPPDDINKMLALVSTETLLNLTTLLPPIFTSIIFQLLPAEDIAVRMDNVSTEDIARLVPLLDLSTLENILNVLSPEIITRLLSELPENITVSIVSNLQNDTLANINNKLSPQQAVIVLSSLPPDVVLNMLLKIPIDNVLRLLSKANSTQLSQLLKVVPTSYVLNEIPADEIGNLVLSLSLDDLFSTLNFLNSEVIMNLTLKMNRDQFSQLLLSMAREPDGLATFMISIPPGDINKLLALVSTETLLNLTTLLPPIFTSIIFQLLPAEDIAVRMDNVSTEDIARLVPLLDLSTLENILNILSPEVITRLLSELPENITVSIVSNLQNDTLANINNKLSPQQAVIVLSSLPPDVVLNMLLKIPIDNVLRLLSKANSTQLSQLLKVVPTSYVLDEIPADEIGSLVLSLTPVDLLGTLNFLNPEVIVNLTLKMNRDHLSQLLLTMAEHPSSIAALVFRLSNDGLIKVMSVVPTDTLLNITTVLPTTYTRLLLKLLPAEDIAVRMDNVSTEAIAGLIPVLDFAVLENILNLLSSNVITRLLSELPENTTVKIMSALRNDTIVNITNKLSPGQVIVVLSSLPSDVVDDLLNKLPVDIILKLMNNASTEQLSKLLHLVPDSYVWDVITSLSADEMVNLSRTLPPANLGLILLALNSSQVSSVLALVPHNIVLDLVVQLPPELLANLTDILPDDNVTDILMSLNSSTVSSLVRTFPKQSLASLIQRLQRHPEVLLNLTLSLSNDSLAYTLESLPGQQVAELVQSFPKDIVNELVLRLPGELILSLVSMLDQSFITDMPLGVVLQVIVKMPGDKLFPLINESGILNSIPPDFLSNILTSVTPDQIELLLNAISPDVLQNLVGTLLPSLIEMLTQNKNIDLAGIVGSAVESILNSVQNIDSKQLNDLMTGLVNALVNSWPVISKQLPNIISGLMSSPALSELGKVLPSVFSSLFDSVPLTKLLSLLAPLIPEIPRTLAHVVGQVNVSRLDQRSSHDIHVCLADIQVYLNQLAEGEDWAIRMFDATGKPGRGLLRGNIHMHGSFDECMDVSYMVTSKREIKGTNCGIELGLPPGVLPPIPGEEILPDVQVELYLCLPNSCTTQGLSNLMSSVNLPLNITIPRVSCEEAATVEGNGDAIAALAVLAILGLLIAIGTILDVLPRSKDIHLPRPKHKTVAISKSNEAFVPEGSGSGNADHYDITVDVGNDEKQTSFSNSNGPVPQDNDQTESDEKRLPQYEDRNESTGLRALLAFSVLSNTNRILGINDATDSITCLHGIRVLSMCWIIVGQTIFFMATFFENALDAAEVLETAIGQLVINSTLAVDSYFVISGCLTTFVFLQETVQNGAAKAKDFVVYFLRRYVRLTPAYAVALMVFTCLLPFMSDGPNWTRESTAYFHSCKTYWWTNILYINNFYKSLDKQCVPWGWYLATDLQLHWIAAPFVLVPFALGYKIVSSVVIGGLVILQIALTVYLQDDVNGDYLRNRDEYWWQIFEKPYTRVAPFAFGMGLGYILARLKGKLQISKAGCVVGWFFAIAICIAAVFVKYDENRVMLEEAFHWSQGARSAYEALFRPLFSLGLCWVILMCATGNGSIINSILSWPVFIPLSRLTFCMFLLHPAVILGDIWQTRVTVYFTISYALQRASGYIMLSAIFAFFLSVTVETPVNVLEKTIFHRKPKRKTI